jgi:hypothetical protein
MDMLSVAVLFAVACMSVMVFLAVIAAGAAAAFEVIDCDE